MSTLADVGQFVDSSSSVLRPPGIDELRAYGILRRIRGARVVDIGCGDGRLALAAAHAGAASVIGVDPDEEALRAARHKARKLGVRNVSFLAGAAQELPFTTERFDIALLSWTL